MNVHERVKMVNLLLRERSIFIHFVQGEIFTSVSITVNEDYADYSYRFTRDAVPGGGTQRILFSDNECKSVIVATNAILQQRDNL